MFRQFQTTHRNSPDSPNKKRMSGKKIGNQPRRCKCCHTIQNINLSFLFILQVHSDMYTITPQTDLQYRYNRLSELTPKSKN